MNAILSVGMNLLFSFLSITSLGAVLGFSLALATRFFAVKKAERSALLETALPGLNCGVCGFAGCFAYAEALAAGGAAPVLCAPGGPNAAVKIAQILGLEDGIRKDKMVTQVHCRGGSATAEFKYKYRGLDDCNGATCFSAATRAACSPASASAAASRSARCAP
jgi:RnfABCDGE-type electron transport complex B subunit